MRHIVGRLRNRTAAFTHDLLMIPCAWFSAYWLRFNLEQIPLPIFEQAATVLPVVLVVQGAVFWYLGLYRGVWRFASLPDLFRILNAVIVGVALSSVAIFFITRMVDVPRSVIPLFGMLLVAYLSGPRLLYRWLKERALRANRSTRVLVVGAGSSGEGLVREMSRDPALGWKPVGFVDDASEQRGREIHGVRVLAKCGRLPDVVREHRVDLVVLATPNASARDMRRLVGYCEKAKVPFRTLPRAEFRVEGQTALMQLRDVSIEDLLGRDAVVLDWEGITRGVANRVVLISGGGGSIGGELARQVATLAPSKVVVFDNSEFNLYSIDQELRALHPTLNVEAVLGDVADVNSVQRCIETHRPAVVFHAAAYKHVPMLEEQVRAAVHNNVIGTHTVATAAARCGCEAVILISTDKAVNPTNVMGATKRVAELLVQNLDREFPRTRFVTVRFGNVLDSAGSVVPLFRRQIASGGPVTVTHPEMKRYFMTIPEACQLILQAAALGKGGEIFVLDMGEPIKISYLAEQMILLSGRRVGDDIEIVYTGLRPGEKLFEELFHDEERLQATSSDKILLARSREVPWERLERAVETINEACDAFNDSRLRQVLRELVPEYSPTSADGEADAGESSNVVSLSLVTRKEEQS